MISSEPLGRLSANIRVTTQHGVGERIMILLSCKQGHMAFYHYVGRVKSQKISIFCLGQKEDGPGKEKINNDN